MRRPSTARKNLVIAGLTLACLLFQFGFVTIGGEWFGMWMSQQWNGVPSAFRYLMTIIAVLIFVAMPDGTSIDPSRKPRRGHRLFLGCPQAVRVRISG